MALPSSGTLTLTAIKAEIPSESNSFSEMSVQAGFSLPHAMSEFYGYSGGTTPPTNTGSIYYTLIG